jgi:hypothetical protein
MNGAAQTFIGTAPANIGDICVDFGIRRLGKVLQKRNHGHDLPRLAVAALRNAFCNPCALHRMAVVWGEAFDGDNLRAIEGADRHRTGSHRGAVNMHRASAALRDTAAEFCASQADHVAQHPEKRRIRLDVDLPGRSVDCDRDHCGSPALSGLAAGLRTVPGVSVVNADRTRAVGYELKQAASHDQILNEMERLVGIGKVRVKEHCCGQAE